MSVLGGRCERICNWVKIMTVLAACFTATACAEELIRKATGDSGSESVASNPIASKEELTRKTTSNTGSEPVVSHPIARVAQEQGIQTCLPAIADVTTFISRGAPTGAHVFLSGEKNNEQLFSVSLETDHPNATVYSSASFSPAGAGCSGSYDVVSYVEGKCEAVAGKHFSNVKTAGKIRENVTVYNMGPTARAFLMPAGSGCLVIRKVVFEGAQAKSSQDK